MIDRVDPKNGRTTNQQKQHDTHDLVESSEIESDRCTQLFIQLVLIGQLSLLATKSYASQVVLEKGKPLPGAVRVEIPDLLEIPIKYHLLARKTVACYAGIPARSRECRS